MTKQKYRKLIGTRVEFDTCPQCLQPFHTHYTLPSKRKHFIQMCCGDCEIRWEIDERSLLLNHGDSGEEPYVTYVVSGVEQVFVD